VQASFARAAGPRLIDFTARFQTRPKRERIAFFAHDTLWRMTVNLPLLCSGAFTAYALQTETKLMHIVVVVPVPAISIARRRRTYKVGRQRPLPPHQIKVLRVDGVKPVHRKRHGG